MKDLEDYSNKDPWARLTGPQPCARYLAGLTNSVNAAAARLTQIPYNDKSQGVTITLASDDKNIIRWPTTSKALLVLWYGQSKNSEFAYMRVNTHFRASAAIFDEGKNEI